MAVTTREGWCPASIRTTNGVSLEEISNNTKIKLSTLQALEEGEFEQLPGGIYNISYIRQYARAIGADEGSLIELYRTKFQATI
jgi:cytoskeleton protein RodZ